MKFECQVDPDTVGVSSSTGVLLVAGPPRVEFSLWGPNYPCSYSWAGNGETLLLCGMPADKQAYPLPEDLLLLPPFGTLPEGWRVLGNQIDTSQPLYDIGSGGVSFPHRYRYPMAVCQHCGAISRLDLCREYLEDDDLSAEYWACKICHKELDLEVSYEKPSRQKLAALAFCNVLKKQHQDFMAAERQLNLAAAEQSRDHTVDRTGGFENFAFDAAVVLAEMWEARGGQKIAASTLDRIVWNILSGFRGQV